MEDIATLIDRLLTYLINPIIVGALIGAAAVVVAALIGAAALVYVSSRTKKEDTAETAKKVIKILRKEGAVASPQSSSPDEKQTLNEILQKLLKNTSADYKPIQNAIKAGNLEQAEALLEEFTEKHRKPSDQHDEALVEALVERAALLNWKAPERSYQLLREATEVNTNDMLAFNQLGHIASRLGKMEEAEAAYQRVLTLAEQNQDVRNKGAALGNFGNVYQGLGDYRKAEEHYRQALVIAREIGNKQGEGNALGNLGSVYFQLGDYRKAEEHYRQALVIAREIGNKQSQGNALNNLGTVYQGLGEYRKAEEHYRQALVIAREIGDKQGEGNALGNLGNVYLKQGDSPRARQHYQKALAIFESIGSPDAQTTRQTLAILAECEQGH